MSQRPIHWHEGMFLRPHHFLAAQRHVEDALKLGDRLGLHYAWGVRSIEVDRAALANNRLVVNSLIARFRDGTVVVVPEDAVLTPLDLKGALEGRSSITAYLALPLVAPGRPNAAPLARGPSTEDVRYLVGAQTVEDENTGVNPQPVQVRHLNVRLLLSTHDHVGFEVLPIGRILKSAKAEAPPELDTSYIPPLLACDGWRPLAEGILGALNDRIGTKLDLLSSQVLARNITFDSFVQGEQLVFEQLRELNMASATLGFLATAEGVHPFWAFGELCRIVGQLAIFGFDRRLPQLPKYDHDDLGRGFYRLKQLIDSLLDILIEPQYRERPFVGVGLRMQVALEPNWLETAWELYIGVQSPLERDECIRLLTKPGQLDMKIGSSDRADMIYRLGQAGLRFTASARPPRVLPSSDLIYFQINRDAAQAEWQHVTRSLTLAIRLNENLIAGDIQGQRILTIRTPTGESATMQFILYVVPKEG